MDLASRLSNFRMVFHGASTDVEVSYTFHKNLNHMLDTAVKRKFGLHYVLIMKSILFFEYKGLKLLYLIFVEKFDFF